MLIKSENKYIPTLTDLWHKVFGDSEEYIKLFFDKAYYDCDCFAEIDEDTIVSAFYLLKCSIKFEGKTYNGRYLYAAATLPEHRGKSLMSKLINEALKYGKNEKLDFIALVPADDGLYDYYGRFGFKESMYKYMVEISSELKGFASEVNADVFGKIRNTVDCNMLVYNKIGSEYAFNCLKFYDSEILLFGDSVCYTEGEELLFADSSLYPADVFSENKEGSEKIYTNYPFKNAVKIRNGMIYNFRDDIEFKDIYMNIALD